MLFLMLCRWGVVPLGRGSEAATFVRFSYVLPPTPVPQRPLLLTPPFTQLNTPYSATAYI